MPHHTGNPIKLEYALVSDANGCRKCMIAYDNGRYSPAFTVHATEVLGVAERIGLRWEDLRGANDLNP